MGQSTKVLGNDRVGNLLDVLVVDVQRFQRAQSQEVAAMWRTSTRARRGESTVSLDRRGGWGSNDGLGIPVEWDDISGARVILEVGFEIFA
jgi:hypothetical protein